MPPCRSSWPESPLPGGLLLSDAQILSPHRHRRHHQNHVVQLSHWHSSMGDWQTAQASRIGSVGLATSRVQINLIHYSLILNLAWGESNASFLFHSNVGVLHVLAHCTSYRFKPPWLKRLQWKSKLLPSLNSEGAQSKGFVFVQLFCSHPLKKTNICMSACLWCDLSLLRISTTISCWTFLLFSPQKSQSVSSLPSFQRLTIQPPHSIFLLPLLPPFS